MASKKIYKHHERTTISSALSDAQPREIVAGSGSREVVYTFDGGSTVRLTSHVFNVLDYGADNTGSTDSYSALTAASTAAAAVSGSVFLPPGTFLTSQPWIIPSNVCVKGSGFGSIVKATNGFLGTGYRGVITVDALSSNVTFADFMVDGNRAGQNQSLAISDYNNISLLSCSGVYGFNIRSINGCGRSSGSGGDGIYIGEYPTNGNPSNIHFFASQFGNNWRQGASIICGNHISFSKCRFYGSAGAFPGDGVDIEPDNSSQSVQDVTFEGCEFYSNTGKGFHIYNGIALASISNIRIRGGKIYSNASNGFCLDGEQLDRDIQLIGVEFTGNGDDEILIGKSFGMSVRECYIHDTSYNAICLEHNTGSRTDINNLKILDNRIITVGKNGILCNYNAGGQTARISGNEIINCSNGSSGTYFPINFFTSGAKNFGFQIFGNSFKSDSTFTGSGYMTYGVNIPASCNSIKVYCNDFDSFTTGLVNNLGSNNFVQWNWNSGNVADTTAQNSTGIGPIKVGGQLNVSDEGVILNRASGSGYINFQNGTAVDDVLIQRSPSTGGIKIATSSSQKLGFFGATPVARQSGAGETAGFTAGTGTTVTDASTFTGNVGTTAYRMSDVVKALKNYGFLAS